MIDAKPHVRVTMRIPAAWDSPQELLDQIPEGYLLKPDHMVLPDGTKIEMSMLPPDAQFASIFDSSCRRPAAPAEIEIVKNFKVMICLSGLGGSLENGAKLMEAAAAIITAGGGGVFVDNSGIAHGGGLWKEMAEDGSPDALSFAFVTIYENQTDRWTMGMHILGRPEVIVSRSELLDQAEDEENLVEILNYLCASDRDFGDGHVIADENGPRFQAMISNDDRFEAGSPMYNPWGRLKLVSIKEIAENN